MGKKRVYKTGYIIVQVNDEGNIVDTLDATFDQATAQEMVLTYAQEWIYRKWFYRVHGKDQYEYGYISMIYQYNLLDAPIEIREIKWYESMAVSL